MRTQTNWGRLGSNARIHHGVDHAAIITAEIQYAGENLLVTTPGLDGSADASRTIRFLPQPLSAESSAPLDREALLNAGQGMPTNFICAGDQSVKIGDEITYLGATWTVLDVQPERFQGVTLMWHCPAARTSGETA